MVRRENANREREDVRDCSGSGRGDTQPHWVQMAQEGISHLEEAASTLNTEEPESRFPSTHIKIVCDSVCLALEGVLGCV